MSTNSSFVKRWLIGLKRALSFSSADMHGWRWLRFIRPPGRIGRQTAGIDPLLLFKVDPMNGREARESGLRLNASIAPTAVLPSEDIRSIWSGP